MREGKKNLPKEGGLSGWLLGLRCEIPALPLECLRSCLGLGDHHRVFRLLFPSWRRPCQDYLGEEGPPLGNLMKRGSAAVN